MFGKTLTLGRLVTALDSMHKNKKSRILVVRDARLVGVLTLEDVLGSLALKMELEAPA